MPLTAVVTNSPLTPGLGFRGGHGQLDPFTSTMSGVRLAVAGL